MLRSIVGFRLILQTKPELLISGLIFWLTVILPFKLAKLDWILETSNVDIVGKILFVGVVIVSTSLYAVPIEFLP